MPEILRPRQPSAVDARTQVQSWSALPTWSRLAGSDGHGKAANSDAGAPGAGVSYVVASVRVLGRQSFMCSTTWRMARSWARRWACRRAQACSTASASR
jgi:hypothetical protein